MVSSTALGVIGTAQSDDVPLSKADVATAYLQLIASELLLPFRLRRRMLLMASAAWEDAMDAAIPSSTLAVRAWPDGGPTRVPNWVYTDPAIFQREMQRIGS